MEFEMNKTLAQEYFQQADVLLNSRKYKYSIIYYEKAVKEDPFLYEAYIHMGIALTNLEQYESAEENFHKALMVNKDNGTGYYHLGNINFLRDNSTKGREFYQLAISKGYENAQIYYNIGLAFEEEGNFVLAHRNYAKAIHMEPLRDDIYVRKIRLYLREKENMEALQVVDEMLIYCPDIYDGYHLKVSILKSMGEYEKAKEILFYAKEMFPKDVAFDLDEVQIYIEQKHYEDALKLLNQAEKKDNNNYHAFGIAMQRANVYAMMQDMNGTILFLKAAKKVSLDKKMLDNVPEINFFLMNCYINLEQYEEGLSYARELKEMTGENKNTEIYRLSSYYYEAFCINKLNRKDEAYIRYQKGNEYLRNYSLKHPENMECYVFRILCLRELKMYDKALELADYMVLVKDETAQAHTMRAMILTEMGLEDEAKEEKKKVQSLGGILSKLPLNII